MQPPVRLRQQRLCGDAVDVGEHQQQDDQRHQARAVGLRVGRDLHHHEPPVRESDDADADQDGDDPHEALEQVQSLTEERLQDRQAERLQEVIGGLQPEADETQEDDGVQRTGDRSPADHPRLQDDLLERRHQASGELVGPHPIGTAAQNVSDLRSQVLDEQKNRAHDEHDQHQLLHRREGHVHSRSRTVMVGPGAEAKRC